MPLFIPSQFMDWFHALWLPGGDRAPDSWFPHQGLPTPPTTAPNPDAPGRTFVSMGSSFHLWPTVSGR